MQELRVGNFIGVWRRNWAALYNDGRMGVIAATFETDRIDVLKQTIRDKNLNINEQDIEGLLDLGLFWIIDPYPTAGCYKNFAPVRLNNYLSISMLSKCISDEHCCDKGLAKKLLAIYSTIVTNGLERECD